MGMPLTSHTRQQLTRKTLNLTVGKRDEVVTLEKVEDAGAKQIHDDADVASEIETISQMNASIPVFLVVRLQSLQDSQFDPRGISILLDGPNDLDGNQLVSFPVASLDHLAKGSLAKKFVDLVWSPVSSRTGEKR